LFETLSSRRETIAEIVSPAECCGVFWLLGELIFFILILLLHFIKDMKKMHENFLPPKYFRNFSA